MSPSITFISFHKPTKPKIPSSKSTIKNLSSPKGIFPQNVGKTHAQFIVYPFAISQFRRTFATRNQEIISPKFLKRVK